MNKEPNNAENYYTSIMEIKIYVDFMNNRLKILTLDKLSINSIREIISFSYENNLGKIICYSNYNTLDLFVKCGFKPEGIIDGYYRGEDAICLSFYTREGRGVPNDKIKNDYIVDMSISVSGSYIPNKNHNCLIRTAVESDVNDIIELFKQVFSSYPSPIYDKNYLIKSMKENVIYKVAIENGKIVSIASADMDKENLNAEVTDCATNPKYRGKGILADLIYYLEEDVRAVGYLNLYSLCRSKNFGINAVLSKHSFVYRGSLINNCNICGGFEDMNIWVKCLS